MPRRPDNSNLHSSNLDSINRGRYRSATGRWNGRSPIDTHVLYGIGKPGLHPLLQAAWRHAYGYPSGYGAHHAFGGGWIGHMVVSSIVHGLVYGVIFRLLSHLGLGGTVVLAVLVIGGLIMWNRNKGYRRW